PDGRLTLERVAALRGAGVIDLDALQFTNEAERHRGNQAWRQTGILTGDIETDPAALAGDEMGRLLFGQPDLEVRLVALIARAIDVKAQRVCHRVQRVRDLDDRITCPVPNDLREHDD